MFPKASPITITWEGPQNLFVGCSSDGPNDNKKVYFEKHRIEIDDLRQNIDLEKYGKPNDWWPVGTYQLKLGFAHDAYISSLWDNGTRKKEAQEVASIINSFIGIIKNAGQFLQVNINK